MSVLVLDVEPEGLARPQTAFRDEVVEDSVSPAMNRDRREDGFDLGARKPARLGLEFG